MSAYYNEIDDYAAEWLRNLIAAGHIAPGEVDERSITAVSGDDLRGFTQCHFFAGIGVWSHALRLAGWGDDRAIWTGSCPCQPFSNAGAGLGFQDERHLWPEMDRLIEECGPIEVIGEQVASGHALEWFDAVAADLERKDYACGAVITCAAGIGAPHARSRLYWAAHRNGERGPRLEPRGSARQAGPWRRFGEVDLRAVLDDPYKPGDFWPQPLLRKMDAGTPTRVDRLRAYGNGLCAPQAQAFIEAFMECRP